MDAVTVLERRGLDAAMVADLRRAVPLDEAAAWRCAGHWRGRLQERTAERSRAMHAGADRVRTWWAMPGAADPDGAA